MQKEILNNIKNDYIELTQDDNWDYDNYYREAQIYGKIIAKYSNGLIKETNKLWFYLTNMLASNYEKIFNKQLDNIAKDSIVCVYIDIENSNIVTCVTLDKQPDFEEANKILRGNRHINDYQDRYYNIRYKFFKLCIELGEEEAINNLLKEENINTYEEIEDCYLKKCK